MKTIAILILIGSISLVSSLNATPQAGRSDSLSNGLFALPEQPTTVANQDTALEVDGHIAADNACQAVCPLPGLSEAVD